MVPVNNNSLYAFYFNAVPIWKWKQRTAFNFAFVFTGEMKNIFFGLKYERSFLA